MYNCEETFCSVCEEALDDPVPLPCRHVCCVTCTLRCWDLLSRMAHCPRCYEIAPSHRHPDLDSVSQFSCGLCGHHGHDVEKLCLHCEEGCCRLHAEEHRHLPCGPPGHLLVNIGDLPKWTCPRHGGYMTHYCEEERKYLCQHCIKPGCNPSHTPTTTKQIVGAVSNVHIS